MWYILYEGKKVYFASDPVILGTDLSRTERMRRSVCMQGDWNHFGRFDLAVIPIGYMRLIFTFRHLMSSRAYEPRWFMLTRHCASHDSVRIC